MNLETFFKNFDLLADAPNSVQKLRELILQLAVMGKLVPQDENDEPASVLLEKITADKKLLVKEKKIETWKHSEAVHINEQQFSLPKGWEWVRLEQIANMVHYGYTASANNNITDVRLLRITDIQNNRVNWNSVPGCDIDKNKLDAFKLNDGDLLIARTGGTIGKSYLVENLSICAVFASYLIRIIPNAFLLPRYLKIFLESPLYWIQLYAKSMGTGQPNVNATSLKTLTVPLPPLAEQHRIVAKVDELMAMCDRISSRQQQKRETRILINNAAIGQLLTAREPEVFNKSWQHICNNFDLLYSTPDNIGKLRQAILQLAVQGKLVPQDENDEPASVLLEKIRVERELLVKEGKIKKEKLLPAIEKNDVPFELPEHWKWTRFGEIILYIESGWSPMCEKHPKEGNEWGVLKVSAVTWDNFNPSENKALPVSFEPRPEHEVKVGDFLMSRANTSQLIAKSVIVETTPERLLLSDKLLRVFFSDFTDKRFFNLYNNSPVAREYYAKKASGTSTSMRNISRDQIHNMPIPIPPLVEQKRIITKLNQLMSLCDELETKLTQSVTDSEKLMEAAVSQILAANSNKRDVHKSTLLESIPAETTKLETKTAGRRNKKTQDGEALQLNLPLF
jgi:type I restriction enzyme, S subunit